MATVSPQGHVGVQLREWRKRRRLSQLELAIDAGVSARHLSFVETGRSKPGRELLLRVTERLAIPLRKRNALLLAAGHAPAFPERRLDTPELEPVRATLARILDAHDPYPAVVFDRRWNVVAVNRATRTLVDGIDRELLKPPVNLLRVGVALAPRMVNVGQAIAFVRDRLERQIAVTGDEDLARAVDELFAGAEQPAGPLEPIGFRTPDGEVLSFFGMFAGFHTPFEVTTSELALELLFPADAATAAALERRVR